MDTVCSMCTPDNALIQNAVNATSPAPTDRWSPEQATGPPDAEMCDSSIFAWMPKVYSCTKKNCQIDLFFQYPVIPERLTIWVIWNAALGIKKLRLYFEGGRSKTMKNLPAHCDMPFTTRLSVSRKITKLRIYTRDQYVAIDAVEVLSSRNNEICSGCRKLKYKIHREPPFPGKHIQISSDPHFTD
ncbi:hypothetical protein SNE40_021256 [Patella caerulea]|uniref:Pappalysin-1 SD scarf domain-containing protein n=1 Tax=Patella caerulea TaxID=87958 RepID=A0AAN8G3Z9_PATCE